MTLEGGNAHGLDPDPIRLTLNITNIRQVPKGGYEINLPTRRLPLPGTQGVPYFMRNNIS
jgi:hypothetical protein